MKLLPSFEKINMHKIIIWIMRFRRIRFVLTCCAFLFLYSMFVKTDFGDISCYYNMNDGDVLPSVENPTFSPNNKSIFFIDSTCLGKLRMMQACVAESAAISNPRRHIYILLSFPITDSLSKKIILELLSYPNVNVARIDITQFAKGTAVESILVNDIKKSKHPIDDISNILKIVTLHKWGGIFLDSDMIVIKTFEDLPNNWVAKLANGVSTGVLSFAKDDFGRNITSEILKDLAMTYQKYPKARHYNHLDAILIRVLKQFCPNLFTSKSGECNGLKLFSEDLFYPLKVPGPDPYFDNQQQPGIEEEDAIEIPYTYALRSMDYSSYQSNEKWPYESLARIFCPRIYEFKWSL